MKHVGKTLAITMIGALLLGPSQLRAESVMEKVQDKRMELISYLRALKPMVYNFPCEPFPACYDEAIANGTLEETERVSAYNEIQRVYQEGLVYFFEGNYVNAYTRMLDAQRRVERLLEGVSQSYLDRTQRMLRDAIEVRYEDDPTDQTVTDISVAYGPGSRNRQNFGRDREAPHTGRRYDPKNTHWAYNKFRIEKNMEMGYRMLGLAREARRRAIMVDRHLRPEADTPPDLRRKRIEYYLGSIWVARQAKLNAGFIYQLKYPFENYVLQSPYGRTEQDENRGPVGEAQDVNIEDVQMIWFDNPYVLPRNLHPVFDQRVPQEYRRDTTDSRAQIYTEEIDTLVRMQYVDEERRPDSFQQEGGGNANQQNNPGGGG